MLITTALQVEHCRFKPVLPLNSTVPAPLIVELGTAPVNQLYESSSSKVAPAATVVVRPMPKYGVPCQIRVPPRTVVLPVYGSGLGVKMVVVPVPDTVRLLLPPMQANTWAVWPTLSTRPPSTLYQPPSRMFCETSVSVLVLLLAT
ncbi:hypothetical protein GALL_376360 [mine drainage metagenome]|uniref:Uncharacterized protein n=1 Tax=mine drainage metagenome TaxID=410659 RepID=A0A1J5QL08_9ZZZZ